MPEEPAYSSPLSPPADLHLWPEEFASIYLGHLSLLHSIMANPQATPASLFAGYQVPDLWCHAQMLSLTRPGGAEPCRLLLPDLAAQAMLSGSCRRQQGEAEP